MGPSDTTKPLVIKKSPIVLAFHFIVLECVAFGAFSLAALLAHYGKIYRELPLSRILSFQIAEALGILILEVALVMYVFFRWTYTYYALYPDKMIHAQGIFLRRKTAYPLGRAVSVTSHQGLFEKIATYGSVEIENAQGEPIAVLQRIQDPHARAEEILRFIHARNPHLDAPPTLETLLSQDEHEQLEFKSTLRWDMREGKHNRALEKAAMKTIAAFLNSHGGNLVIGVDDSKQIVGLEHDYQTLARKDADGFQNHFSLAFRSMIGPHYRQFVHMKHHAVGGKECAVISVAPSPKPAYLKDGNGEEFFIRTGNGTTSLKLSEAASYIETRFPQSG